MIDPPVIELLPNDGSPYWEVSCSPELVKQLRANLETGHESLASAMRVYRSVDSAGKDRWGLNTSLVIPKRLIDEATLLECIAQLTALHRAGGDEQKKDGVDRVGRPFRAPPDRSAERTNVSL